MEFGIGCCCGDAPVEIRRPLRGGTPRNSDSTVAGYIAEWTVFEWPPEVYDTDVIAYVIKVDSDHFISEIEGVYQYEILARPFRWMFGGLSSLNTFISALCIPSGVENSDYGPASAGHLGEVKTSNVITSFPISISNSSNDRYLLPTGFDVTPTIEHSRVLIDGVDASGVYATQTGIGEHRSTPLNAITVMNEATVHVDAWLKVVVETDTAITEPIDIAMATSASYGFETDNIPHYPAAVGRYTGSNARSLLRRSQYRLDFDRQGPGGASSLVIEPQSGWIYVRQPGYTEMTHESGDVVTIDCAREVPRIWVYRSSATAVPATARKCVYVPGGSAAFDELYKYKETGLEEIIWTLPGRGLWDRDGATTFVNEGRWFFGFTLRLFGIYYPPEANRAGIWGPGSTMYMDFPLTVTMTRI